MQSAVIPCERLSCGYNVGLRRRGSLLTSYAQQRKERVPTLLDSQSPQRLKLTVAYDGTDFAGFQWQKGNVRTVQGEMEKAASRLFHADSRVVGASRTDSGAHARGQIAHMDVYGERDLESDLVQYNGLLPRDLKVTQIDYAPEGFDAHFSSSGKEYHYLIDSDIPDPMQAKQRWWVYDRWCEAQRGKPQRMPQIALDVEAMREAALLLQGTHNFTALADSKKPPGMGALKRKRPKLAQISSGELVERSSDKNNRTMWKVEVIEEAQAGHIRVEVAGDGFLYRMVRMVVAALVEVGHGRMTPERLSKVVEARERAALPDAAPAHGLYLMQVFYNDNPYVEAPVLDHSTADVDAESLNC